MAISLLMAQHLFRFIPLLMAIYSWKTHGRSPWSFALFFEAWAIQATDRCDALWLMGYPLVMSK